MKLLDVIWSLERVKIADAHEQHVYDERSQASKLSELEIEKAWQNLRKAHDALEKAFDS